MDQLPFKVQRIFDSLFSPNANVQTNNMPEPALQSGFGNNDTPNNMDPVIQSLLQPQNDTNKRLLEMMDQQPTHDQFRPGIMRGLVGGLIGINNPSGGEKFINRDYNNAMQDWSGKLKPLAELADSERAQNTNNRLVGSNLLRNQNADLENKRKVAKDEADAKAKQAVVDQKDRFLAYKIKKDANPSHIYKSDKNGYVYSVDPQTNAVEYLTTANGDLIEDSKLPDVERLQIQQNNSMAQISARGVETRKNTAAQGAKEVSVAEKTAPIKEKLKQTVPGKNTAPVQKSTSDMVSVIHPDDGSPLAGKSGSVPKNQLSRALAQGFVVKESAPVFKGIGLNTKDNKSKKLGF